MKWPTVFLLCFIGAGCRDNPTQILLIAHGTFNQGIEQLQISAKNSVRSFPTIRRPEVAASTPLIDPQSVALLLPDQEAAGRELTVITEALRQSVIVDKKVSVVVPRQGENVSLEIWFGQPPKDAGVDVSQHDRGIDAHRIFDLFISDKMLCKPNTFLKCEGNILKQCNETGTAILTQDCNPFLCNITYGRCNECDPESAAFCTDSNLVECSVDGLKKNTMCTLGCSKGSCCVDADKDTISTCDGDCDDMDSNVFPTQTNYFTSPTKGTKNYDFNCDKSEEKEINQLVNCSRLGSNCEGHGWQGSIPSCGVQGGFIQCKPSGMTSCSHEQSQKVQACR